MELATTIENINTEIAQMRNYGYRDVTVKKENSLIMEWSNGDQNWYLWDKSITSHFKKGDTIQLDANQVLINSSFKELKDFLKEDGKKELKDRDLQPLPLYFNSAEWLGWRF